MGNARYQVEHVNGDQVIIRETFDLTKPNGPGIFMRYGKIVDCEAEGIVSAERLIAMTTQQAIQRGLIEA